MSDASDAASISPEKILHEAQNLALLAVSYDQQKDLQAAIYYYSVMLLFSLLCQTKLFLSTNFFHYRNQLST